MKVPHPSDDDGPVTVLATSDPGLIGVAESLLESAEIPFEVRDEHAQDLIGVGRIGGLNYAVGPSRLQVAPTSADDARALLEDLEVT